MIKLEIEGFVFKIKQDPTQRNKHYCVMQNPFNQSHDTKILYGGSIGVVERKIKKQYKKLKGEINNESNY